MKWTWNKIYSLHEKHETLEMLPWQITLNWNNKITKTEIHEKKIWKKDKEI